jgi:hypothetical protein
MGRKQPKYQVLPPSSKRVHRSPCCKMFDDAAVLTGRGCAEQTAQAMRMGNVTSNALSTSLLRYVPRSLWLWLEGQPPRSLQPAPGSRTSQQQERSGAGCKAKKERKGARGGAAAHGVTSEVGRGMGASAEGWRGVQARAARVPQSPRCPAAMAIQKSCCCTPVNATPNAKLSAPKR